MDTGGRGVYGGLELTAVPDLDVSGVEVENLDLENPEAAKWFPHLKAGFEEYQALRESEGKPLGALRLLVTKVLSHETDTNERIMKMVAKQALREVFTKQKGGREVPAEGT
jgi:hypothetical protein